jgi:hypothetical protein
MILANDTATFSMFLKGVLDNDLELPPTIFQMIIQAIRAQNSEPASNLNELIMRLSKRYSPDELSAYLTQASFLELSNMANPDASECLKWNMSCDALLAPLFPADHPPTIVTRLSNTIQASQYGQTETPIYPIERTIAWSLIHNLISQLPKEGRVLMAQLLTEPLADTIGSFTTINPLFKQAQNLPPKSNTI